MLKRSVLKVSTFLMLLLAVVMVFAACGKMEFKVDFIVDDAIYATINTNGEEVLKMPNDPEKDGYVFDGWYWDKDSWKKPFSANSLLDAPLSSNMSVYAKWTTPEQVKGTQAEFAEFEKVTETEYSMKVSNSTASVPLDTLVTVNSRSSWTLSSDIYGNQTIASKTATLAVGDNTYYVLVTAENGATQLYTLKIRRRPVYSVIFDTSGGTAVENQKVEEDSLAETPTTFKTGYSFVSWNYDFTNPVTENKIIVASWKANTYKITYNTNGGDIEAKTADAVYDAAFTLKETTKRGYDFEGWYYSDNLITAGVWDYDTDITLEAHWHATKYTIRYDLGGGVVNGVNPLQYTVEDSNITLVNPTKAGYIFAGWTGTDLTAPTLTVIIGSNSIGNREYVANWTLDGYSITYNLNGGVNSEKNLSEYAVTSANIYLESATRRGYVFDGWYTNADCTADAKITTITSGSTGDITLWAKWTLANYNITYNLNGGEFSSDNPKNYTIESGDITLSAPTKRGYTFVGWMGTDINDTAISVTIRNNSTGDRTYTAVWEIVDYSIIYNLNGGTNAAENPEKYNVASTTITLENPTKLGYVFGGWYTSNDYNDDERVKVIPNGSIGNIELFAKWTPATYSIKFNKNNSKATGTMSNQTLTYDSADTLTANSFVLTGYTFKGWKTNSDGSGTLYINEQEVLNLSSEDGAIVNVYAKWEANTYSVTFDKNGGVNGTNSVSAIYDSAMPTATAPTYAGYNFAGYYDADGVQYYDAEMKSVRNWNKAENTTLYARWNGKTFNVSFDRLGGTGGTTSVAATFNANMPSASAPSKTGYKFKGYFDGRNGTGTQYYSASMSSLHKWDKSSVGSLYAYWEARTYTVSFNYNNGNGNNGSVIATYDSEMPSINGVPTRTGYIFVGYYDSANNGTKYYNADLTSAKTWDKTSNTTLYAHWIGVDYSVRFDGNRSTSGRMDNQAFVYATAQKLNANRFARTGYTFVGWNTEADGNGTSYDNSASVNSLTTENNGIVVLYAQWRANTYRVSLDGTQTTIEKIYTVSFNLNGASGTAPSAQTVNNSVGLSYPNIPTRSGYVFGGWYTTSSCSGNPYNFAAEVTANVTLYAKWISYSGTGVIPYNGSLYVSVVSKSSSTKHYYAFIPLVSGPVTIYTNGGMSDTYGFLYNSNKSQLTYDDDGGDGNNFKITYTVTAGTLYYVWPAGYNSSGNTTVYISGGNPAAGGKTIGTTTTIEVEKTYTVSFNLNGASGTTPSAQTVNNSVGLIYPNIPTRSGYVFGGWYTTSSCSGNPYNFAAEVTADINLYAKWVSISTLSDEITNGENTIQISGGQKTQHYAFIALTSGTITINVGKNAYINIWTKEPTTTSSDGGYGSNGYYSTFSTSVVKGTLYYISLQSNKCSSEAVYIGSTYLNITGSVKPAAGGKTTGNTTIQVGGYSDLTFGSSFTLSTDISRVGYTFAGWYDGIGGTGTQYTDAEGNSVRVWDKAENTTLYPKWNVNQYTISFVSNGGSTVDSITQNYGSAVTAPTKPTWSEKSFVGWFTDSNLTNEYHFTTMSAENITLYAKWIEYSVSISCDDTTEISINDTVTSPDTYNATAIDTDGNPVNITVSVIGGTFAVGKTVAVRLVANGLYSAYATKTISNIKVYGIPTLSYDTKKDYFNLSDILNASLWDASATDTFGTALSVSVSVKESTYSAGDLVTIVISATDITGNEAKVEIAKVKVYGAPVITRDTTKNDMKATDTVSNELFGVSAVDSFGVPLTVTTVKQSGTISGGNTITVKSSATDSKGNTNYITYTVKVYGLPTIGGATKTSFKVDDTISLDTLGIVAKDSFENRLSNVTLTLTEGVQTAGQTLTYLVTATDHLGNVQTRTISGIRIYGTPTILFDTAKESMKVTDTVNANLFVAVAKDSHNGELVVTVTVESGTIAGGNVAKFRLSTVDALGNEYSIVTQDIKVYSSDNITLSYNAAAATRIKKTSRGEEFGASAVDGFGKACAISIEAADGYTLAGGNTINLYLVATDALGNTTKSALITGIKIYDTPKLTFAREKLYIFENENPYELFILTDSFGEEVLYNIEVISGSLEEHNVIAYKITAADRVENSIEEMYQLFVVSANESVLKLYRSGKLIALQRVFKDEHFSLPYFDGYQVTWFLNDEILTDKNAVGLMPWLYDTGIFTLNCSCSVIEYTITYELNGGTNNESNPTKYTIESETITLAAPTREYYKFIGWEESETIPSGSFGDKVFTAKWEAIEYTITYELNGGTNASNPTKYTVESETITLAAPTKTGYKFVGWSNGGKIEKGTTGDKTFVATWEIIEYTITYKLNGGTNNASNPTKYTIESETITLTAPTKRGFIFERWSDNGVIEKGSYGNRTFTAFYVPLKFDFSVSESISSVSKISSSAKGTYETGTSLFVEIKNLYRGYQFDGWYEGDTLISEDAKYMFSIIDNDINLIAQISVLPEMQLFSFTSTVDECEILSLIDTTVTTLLIPDYVTVIRTSAFKNYSGLTSVAIGNSVTSIDSWTFSGCSSLISITIPNSVTYIDSYAFENCSSLISVTIPNSVTFIGSSAFVNCSNLVSIAVGNSVTDIENSAFCNCSSLTNITIPDSVTSVGFDAFSGCSSLISVTIGNSVTSIPNWMFSGCSSLTNITIQDSVTSVGSGAFSGCSSLTSVTIGNSVTSIGSGAFDNCNNLKSVYITDLEKWCKVSFDGNANPLYYAHNLYLNNNLVTDLVIPDGVTTIGCWAFSGCSSFSSITIGISVTDIENHAFWFCGSITSITILESTTNIGEYAFYGCNGIKKVYYKGDENEWDKIAVGRSNNSLTSAARYYYSEDEPTIISGNYWHYNKNGEIEEW